MSDQFAPTPEEPSYWEQIEQYFAAKRGSALILSPKDWPLVHQWEERHIPLEVVYAGIDQAFERVAEQQTPTQHHTIRNLAYCKYDVEAAWKDWQERNPPPVPPDDAAERLIGERRKLQIKLRSTVSQLEKCAATPHYHCISDELTHIASALDGFWPVLEQADDEQILSEFKQRLAALGQELLARLELNASAHRPKPASFPIKRT